MLMPSANNKSVDQSTYESSRINTFVLHFLHVNKRGSMICEQSMNMHCIKFQ